MDCRIIGWKVVARDGDLVSVAPNHFGQVDRSDSLEELYGLSMTKVYGSSGLKMIPFQLNH